MTAKRAPDVTNFVSGSNTTQKQVSDSILAECVASSCLEQGHHKAQVVLVLFVAECVSHRLHVSYTVINWHNNNVDEFRTK
jgi:hypothetical protein